MPFSFRRWLRRGACLLALGGLLPACGADVVAPRGEEPFLYLVLGQRGGSYYGSLDQQRQHALLTTTGSPFESPAYLPARAFRMTRGSDGAEFGWQRYPRLVTEPGTRSRISSQYANYFLADSAGAQGLGAGDLRAGETYHLVVETEYGSIQGTARVPAAFSLRLVRGTDGALDVVWSRVAGAAGYRVATSDGGSAVQTDTTMRLPDALATSGTVFVQALDPNLFVYVSGENVAQAGVTGGYGVFGAVSSAWLDVARNIPSPGR